MLLLGRMQSKKSTDVDKLEINIVKECVVLESRNKTGKKEFKQYSIKLPARIVDYFKIKKGDKIRLNLNLAEGEEPKKTFEVIKDGS